MSIIILMPKDLNFSGVKTLREFEEPKPKKKRRPYRCSFCGETGHNRQTCPHLKEYIRRCKQ